MSSMDEVLIVGGGIGGLTAAVALDRAGIPVRVFEQAPELREVGAGVSLWPNAMRALATLGLDGAILGVHVPMEEIVIRRNDGSTLLRLREPGRYPEPGICVHRAHLQRTLAAAMPPDRLHLDQRLVDIRSDADGATAIFHDGSTARGRLLIGCDGIRSTARARIHGAAPARYRGYEIWRGVSDFSLSNDLLRRSTEWWAPGQRFGLLPGEPGRVYWYGTHSTGRRPESGSAVGGSALGDGEDRDRLEALFRHWTFPVPALMEAAAPGDVVRTLAEDRPVPRRWGRGPVTLLGDAAHPMTPNMGQGACTAIEDAVVLARCLAGGGPTPAALRRYEDGRRSRTRWILRQSRRIGRVAQLRNPVLVAVRNRIMGLIPERLLDIPQRRVYG